VVSSPVVNLLRMFLLLLACLLAAQGNPAFFIVAHPDDWQLFMGQNAFVDIQSGEGAVLIYVTAGDAGAKDLATGAGTVPYFRARELAANQSVILAAGAGNDVPPGSGEWSAVSINGRDIARWTYGHTTSYYLRLPDGGGSGAGYQATGWQSLARFYRGEISAYDAVDGSASHSRWSDLAETVAGIIQRHVGEPRDFWVNLHDPNRDLNVDDHSDHTHSGILALEAAARADAGHLALWLDYVIGDMDPNLLPEAVFQKAGLFGSLNATLTALGYRTTWDRSHLRWLDKGVYRTVTRKTRDRQRRPRPPSLAR